MTTSKSSLVVATGSAMLMTLAAALAPVHAQEAPQPQPTEPQPSQPQTQPMQPQAQPPAGAETQLDEETLKSFAQASLDVEQVITEWTPRIQGAEGEEQATEMRESANQEIVEAVQSNGLELETYNQIYQLAQADQTVASSIQQYREELQQ